MDAALGYDKARDLTGFWNVTGVSVESWLKLERRFPTHWVLVRIALKRQFRSWRLWWLFLVLGQLMFAAVIVFAFSTLFPRVSGRGGTLAYAFSVYAGILVWSLIQDAALQAMNLYRDHRAYLMRFRVPLWSYAVGAGGVRAVVLAIGVALLLGGQLVLVGEVTLRWLLLPVFIPLALALSLGISWIVATLAALEPRLQQLLPHVFLFWFFATPVVYPRASLPDALRLVVALNPMTHVVECFQWIFVATRPTEPLSWLVTAVVSLLACVAGFTLTQAKKRALLDAL